MCTADAGTQCSLLVVAWDAGVVDLSREPCRVASESSPGCHETVGVVEVVESLEELTARRRQVIRMVNDVDFAKNLETVCRRKSRNRHYGSTVWYYEFAVWSIEFISTVTVVSAVSVDTSSIVLAWITETFIFI